MSTWWAKYDTIDPKEGRDGGQKHSKNTRKQNITKNIYI